MVTVLCWEIADPGQQQQIFHEIQASVPGPPHEWSGNSAVFDYSSSAYQNLVQALDALAAKYVGTFRYYVFQFLTNQFRFHRAPP